MNLIVWLVVGGIVGWLASIIMKRDAQQGILLNIVVGIIGALLAGWIISPLVGVGSINDGLSVGSFLVSLVGAVILLAIVNLFTRGRTRRAEPGPAFLPRFRTGLPRQGAGSRVAQQPADQRAFAEPVSHRDRAQPRRLVCRIRRAARPGTLPAAEQTRPRLVNAGTTKQCKTAPKGAVFACGVNANQRLTMAFSVQKTYTRPGAN